MKFAHVLGVINGTIILTVLFFTMVGIYALIRKVLGLFRPKQKDESFWVKRRLRPPTIEEMKRQF